MNKFGLITLASFLLLACKNEKKNTLSSPEVSEVKGTENTQPVQEAFGLWSGIFLADSADYQRSEEFSTVNRISIVIQSINSKNEVEGYSVTAGNLRPFKGTLMDTDSTQYIVASEPGDAKYDGTFKFNLSKNKDSIYGMWYAKNPKLPVFSRNFSLKNKVFKYDPNMMLKAHKYEDGGVDPVVDWVTSKVKTEKYDGEEYQIDINRSATDAIYKINASTQKLTEKELKALRRLDLEIIRNTIYARHGYSFANKGARQYFDAVDWYIPLFTTVEDKLTTIEKENIILLKRLEKYAKDYYEQYGR